MTLRSWGTALRDALHSMTQSALMSIASIATVTVSLLVLAVVLLLAFNLEHMATSVEQQVEIKVYLCAANDENPKCGQKEPTAAELQAAVAEVQKIPGVKQAKFVSREEAFERMKKEFGEQKDVLEGIDATALRNSIEVQTEETKLVQSVATSISALAVVSMVNYGQEYVEKLLAFTQAVRYGGIGLVLMLVIATVLTIANTVRLAVYARRREISIMKLVGATDWYIRRPFMVEGIFLGSFGAMLAMLLTGSGYNRVVTYMYTNVPFLPVLPPQEVLTDMTTSLMVLGGVLGAIGSLVSMRRFLKV
jgi:cell division transport system permease protein